MELSAELSAAVWWSTILLLKLATFGIIVGFTRARRGVSANPEDAAAVTGGKPELAKTTDVVVERRRR